MTIIRGDMFHEPAPMDVLEKWRRLMMSENFILYLRIKADTRLEYYLSTMKGLSKREAFHCMSLFCAGLKLPA